MNSTMLEITGSFDLFPNKGRPPRVLDEIVEEEVANSIDLAKWALMEVIGGELPLREGAITFELASDTSALIHGRSFRRQDNRSGAVYRLDSDQVRRASGLLSKAIRLRPASRDLQQAFFYWGRSAVAELDRDQLLDAVIGLEDLLVPHSGDSRYRFKLHGTALLARFCSSVEECSAELNKLYDARSSAAHGNPGEGVVEAPKARRLLGNAIEALIELGETGVLNLASKVKVASQIEKLILQNSPIKLTPDSPTSDPTTR
jgi:hypothetical protein